MRMRGVVQNVIHLVKHVFRVVRMGVCRVGSQMGDTSTAKQRVVDFAIRPVRLVLVEVRLDVRHVTS